MNNDIKKFFEAAGLEVPEHLNEIMGGMTMSPDPGYNLKSELIQFLKNLHANSGEEKTADQVWQEFTQSLNMSLEDVRKVFYHDIAKKQEVGHKRRADMGNFWSLNKKP